MLVHVHFASAAVVAVSCIIACSTDEPTATRDAAVNIDAAAGATADAAAVARRWLPTAPSGTDFGWQGQQQQLHDDVMECNDAQVVVAMGDAALCFVAAADGMLHCAGRVYDQVFGSSFVSTGQRNVDQILISLTANSANGNALCVHKTDKTAWCFGNMNDWGQLNVGAVGPVPVWTRWGTRDALEEFATGTFDQMCGRYDDGDVECVGNGFGLQPVLAGTSLLERIWVDTYGQVRIDDETVFRAGNSRSECQVKAAGLECALGNYGSPGMVVDGNSAGINFDMNPLNDGETVCWLNNLGQVWCQPADVKPGTVPALTQLFVGANVLALAVNLYSFGDLGVLPARCAVYHDGSLWCIGSNAEGKLGTGDTLDLLTETMVAGPGSVRINCNDD